MWSSRSNKPGNGILGRQTREVGEDTSRLVMMCCDEDDGDYDHHDDGCDAYDYDYGVVDVDVGS